ncbi:hypothetical protein vBVhaSVHB1_79 [Vibrio phage vB_VhaS-VHB1]|nr:hypothetical protein vBVhaSVHB1_79 [Vibrio phage vB_VhaS-VHB1]
MIVFTNAAGSLKHFTHKKTATFHPCDKLTEYVKNATALELSMMLDNVR